MRSSRRDLPRCQSPATNPAQICRYSAHLDGTSRFGKMSPVSRSSRTYRGGVLDDATSDRFVEDGFLELRFRRTGERRSRMSERDRRRNRPPSADRPRATRSASSAVTIVLFSVSPSHRPTGTFVPSVQIANATTQHTSAKCTPSSINAASLSSDRPRLINSSKPAWVAVLKRRPTDDRDVDRALAPSWSPTGSFTRT